MVDNDLIKVDKWMRLNTSINYTKSLYLLTGKSIDKAEEKQIISKITLIMLCYIGFTLKGHQRIAHNL